MGEDARAAGKPRARAPRTEGAASASDPSGSQARQTVVIALDYVFDLRDEVVKLRSSLDAKETVARRRKLARAIMRDMRSTLPVPAIYVALRVLQRLHLFALQTAHAFEEDEAVPRLPPSENHVDFTVKQIWRSWLAALQKIACSRSDWEDAQWNFYADLADTLKEIVEYNTKRYFDISFYEDNDAGDEAAAA